jgi:hypothetical protein
VGIEMEKREIIREEFKRMREGKRQFIEEKGST